MYYPYMRGKQYELIAIRECAGIMKARNFVPIIEPVKESVSGLERTLRAIAEIEGKCVLVINPQKGDHYGDNDSIEALVNKFPDFSGLTIGVLACAEMTADQVRTLCSRTDKDVALIHSDFTDGRALSEAVSQCSMLKMDVFLDSSSLYRRHFQGRQKIMIKDGFRKQSSNRKYPPLESFSDLHATFEDMGMNGFGDFLTIGSDYSEAGGPAWAVAIHLTFIDSSKDDEMYVHHFVSDRQNSPSDPGGKFLEALKKLVSEVQHPDSHIYRSRAVEEYLSIYSDQRYPGLGYNKKLSMQHHIETFGNYFEAR